VFNSAQNNNNKPASMEQTTMERTSRASLLNTDVAKEIAPNVMSRQNRVGDNVAHDGTSGDGGKSCRQTPPAHKFLEELAGKEKERTVRFSPLPPPVNSEEGCDFVPPTAGSIEFSAIIGAQSSSMSTSFDSGIFASSGSLSTADTSSKPSIHISKAPLRFFSLICSPFSGCHGIDEAAHDIFSISTSYSDETSSLNQRERDSPSGNTINTGSSVDSLMFSSNSDSASTDQPRCFFKGFLNQDQESPGHDDDDTLLAMSFDDAKVDSFNPENPFSSQCNIYSVVEKNDHPETPKKQ